MNEQDELRNVLNQVIEEENEKSNMCNQKEHIMENATHVNALNVIAYINLVLSMIGAIFVLINYSKSDITDEFSIVGICGAIAIIIAGLTLFFLFKTIVDIYWKVEK